ncbi:MAG: HEAT repeat domain-containing protein [Acaryochloridaceae cyanobacterium RU_4_10]|nr:HEAT repeat domain-containing protein [Acaryochloridaceae cyanobacterium RU_4_10]
MSAITALRHYDADVAVPLLANRLDDPELIVRSFVVMGLGHKRTPEAFDLLVKILSHERDANVRGEAANSLSRYGKESLPYLMQAFDANPNWLVQVSILAVVAELDCPNEVYDLCDKSLDSSDAIVQCMGIEYLGFLEGSIRHADALDLLLVWAESENWMIRRQVALSLAAFEDSYAQKTILRLRQDPDHRVVAATLEKLI